jgi:PAS domain S-box-containing protein
VTVGPSPPSESALQPPLRRLRDLLCRPDPGLDPIVRRKSRLLAAFLLVAIAVFGLVDSVYAFTVPGYVPPWYGYALLLTAWLLNRCDRYRAAATVTLAMFPLVIFTLVVTGSSAYPRGTLSYLVLGILLASILLSWRGVALLTLISLGGLLLMPVLAPGTVPSFSGLVGPFSVTALGAGLSLVFMRHRDLVERDRQEELRTSEARLRLALEAAGMGAWDWEVGTGAVRWWGRVEPMFGLPPGGFGGTYEAYVALIHPDDRPRVEKAIRDVLAGDFTDYEVRHRLAAVDREGRWLEGRGRVEHDDAGRPVRMMGTVRDITDRQREEAEREALIRELEMKNTELERFTYTVSHDLKSPLVTIRGFLGYIERHAAGGRGDLLREDLARIVAASDRMERLLDELLRLSRIGRFANPPEEIGVGEAAAEAVALLRGRLDAGAVEVEIVADLPAITADRLRVVELLQNVIDNAIRFMGDQPHPRIRIGSRREPDGPVFYVRDNGIGIDPAYHERVFGLFDKLDPRTEGTGVGLALARRIVEVHGGRAWIESEGRGHGTTVCFTLPGPPRATSAER